MWLAFPSPPPPLGCSMVLVFVQCSEISRWSALRWVYFPCAFNHFNLEIHIFQFRKSLLNDFTSDCLPFFISTSWFCNYYYLDGSLLDLSCNAIFFSFLFFLPRFFFCLLPPLPKRFSQLLMSTYLLSFPFYPHVLSFQDLFSISNIFSCQEC